MRKFNINGLINWSGLSRIFGVSRFVISENRIPKKYQAAINDLKRRIEEWYIEWIVKKDKEK